MSCCATSGSCACATTEQEQNVQQQNKAVDPKHTNNNHDDFFGDDNHSNNNNNNNDHHDDREMERKTLNRLMQTARNRGKMDETQRLEVDITRKAFCEGFAAGVEEGKLAISKFAKDVK